MAAGFSLQNALHRLPRLRRRAVHDCTPEAPDAVADTNDNAYVNAMEENNIQSVGGPADLIYAGHQLARRWPCTPADPRHRFTVAALLLNLRECPETAGYRL